MVIWILLLFFLILLIGSYFLFKKDLIHPCVIFCAAYSFSIFCAILNMENWDIDLGAQLGLILSLGAIEFVAVNLIVTYFFHKRNKHKQANSSTPIRFTKISVPKWKTLCVILFDTIALTLLIIGVMQIAKKFNAENSISSILGTYRLHTSYRADASLPMITRHAMRIVNIFAYIFSFIVINNFIYSNENLKTKIKTNFLYLIPILTCVLGYFLISSRGLILRFMIADIIIAITLWNNKHHWRRTIPLRKIFLLAISAVVVLIAFFYSASLIGRDTASKNLSGYITLYAGGSIKNLDLYLKDKNPPKPIVPGAETFGDLIRDLNKYKIIKLDRKFVDHLEFRKVNGTTTGNVYTAYRRWYNDFGYIGIIVLQAGMAMFFAVLYNYFKYYYNTKHKWCYNLLLIYYGYLMYTLLTHSIVGQFYNNFAVGTIVIIIIALAEYYFLIGSNRNKSTTSVHTKEQKKVSVIIPTHNREATIKRSIDSVLQQTYTNIEVIIVDDCSNDNTAKLIKQYDDKRLRYTKLRQKHGANYARNRGVAMATGNYVAFQDSDDEWLPYKIETQLLAIEEQGKKIAFSSFEKHVNRRTSIVPKPSFKLPSPSQQADAIFAGNFISTQTLIGEKEVFINNKFDEQMPRFQDWDLAIRLSQQYELAYIKEPLAVVYTQDDSITKKADLGISALSKIEKKYKRYLKQNTPAKLNFERAKIFILWSLHQDIAKLAKQYLAQTFDLKIYVMLIIDRLKRK